MNAIILILLGGLGLHVLLLKAQPAYRCYPILRPWWQLLNATALVLWTKLRAAKRSLLKLPHSLASQDRSVFLTASRYTVPMLNWWPVVMVTVLPLKVLMYFR